MQPEHSIHFIHYCTQLRIVFFKWQQPEAYYNSLSFFVNTLHWLIKNRCWFYSFLTAKRSTFFRKSDPSNLQFSTTKSNIRSCSLGRAFAKKPSKTKFLGKTDKKHNISLHIDRILIMGKCDDRSLTLTIFWLGLDTFLLLFCQKIENHAILVASITFVLVDFFKWASKSSKFIPAYWGASVLSNINFWFHCFL